VEVAEAIESNELKTELLQVKLELVPRLEADQLDANVTGNATSALFYGKLLTASPHWCGYIPWLVQFLVPPCWFGKPDKRNETLGPDGLPVWCHDVYGPARAYVKDCAQSLIDSGDVAQAAPDWCKYIPDGSKKYAADCSTALLTKEWAAVKEANFAFRPVTSLSAVESESSETSAVYGKVLLTSPHWCGNIPWLVQFVVPPCWIGKPADSDVGPDGKPEWCGYLPAASKQYTPECRDVYNTSGSATASAPPVTGSTPATTQAGSKPDWCKWVPSASKGDVPDCR